MSANLMFHFVQENDGATCDEKRKDKLPRHFSFMMDSKEAEISQDSALHKALSLD